MIGIAVKWSGAMLLLLGAVYFGTVMVREEKRRLAVAEAFYSAVQYIRDNIEHFMRPLDEIFSSYKNGLLEECGYLPEVRRVGVREARISIFFGKNELDGEVRELIESFTSKLGGGYREDELRLCDYTLSALGKRCGVIRDELGGKTKIYRTLPPLFVLSLILIFV